MVRQDPASLPSERRLQRPWRLQLLGATLVVELEELSGYLPVSVLRLLRRRPADHGRPPARAGATARRLVQQLEMLWEAGE